MRHQYWEFFATNKGPPVSTARRHDHEGQLHTGVVDAAQMIAATPYWCRCCSDDCCDSILVVDAAQMIVATPYWGGRCCSDACFTSATAGKQEGSPVIIIKILRLQWLILIHPWQEQGPARTRSGQQPNDYAPHVARSQRACHRSPTGTLTQPNLDPNPNLNHDHDR